MKTNYFKIIMQISAITLAIVGSFVTKAASDKKNPSYKPGYVTLDYKNPCSIMILCSPYGSPLCTAMINLTNYQAFGKDISSDPICGIVLYRFDQ